MCEIATPRPEAFKSSIPYDVERIHAAAMYCSDGRVGEHFDDFLQNGLNLPRYDRIALPGGAATLADHFKARLNPHDVLEELRFLVHAHDVSRLVLIAHENCAFYGARLNVDPSEMESLQRLDLAKAARRVHRLTGIVDIEGYFARLTDEGIRFERIDIDPLKPF